MQDERKRQRGLVPIGGNQFDAFEVFVIPVRFRLTGDPAQDEVHRRHHLDFQRVGVEGVFAGRQRLLPDAAMAGLDLLAVAEAGAGDILARSAIVGDHDADVADGDHRLGLDLDGRKPAIDEERAVGEHLELLAALAAEGEERLGVLEIIVIQPVGALGQFRSDDLSGGDRGPILHADDADIVAGQ